MKHTRSATVSTGRSCSSWEGTRLAERTYYLSGTTPEEVIEALMRLLPTYDGFRFKSVSTDGRTLTFKVKRSARSNYGERLTLLVSESDDGCEVWALSAAVLALFGFVWDKNRINLDTVGGCLEYAFDRSIRTYAMPAPHGSQNPGFRTIPPAGASPCPHCNHEIDLSTVPLHDPETIVCPRCGEVTTWYRRGH